MCRRACLFVVALSLIQIKNAETLNNTDDLAGVEKWLSDHAEANLQSLVEFVSIPSVSADPGRVNEVRRCAKWLASDLADAGLQNVELVETDGNPVVYADWLHAENAPTVLIYGHYDVQPEDPVDLWTSPPFEPTVRDGKLYARGASDDKGNMYVPIVAIKAYLRTLKKLPVNVKLLLEGEEEISSPSLESALVKHGEKFRADYSFSADGGMISPTIPCLILRLRGVLDFYISLRVADRDMHSGLFGGGVQNPIHALSYLLSTLRDIKTGKILVDGYYDEVDDLTLEERDEIAKFPIPEKVVLSQNGINSSVGEDSYSFLERISVRPTIELVGIWGGFQGEGMKTVLPREAHAKISCRTVSSQDPERTGRLLKEHLLTEGAKIPGVTVEVKFDPSLDGYPFKMKGDTPSNRVAAKVLTELYNREPVFISSGGSIPAVSILHRVLGLETTIFGFALPDEAFHAPDEFYRLDSFRRGGVAYVRLLNALALSHVTESTNNKGNAKDEL